MHHKGNRSWDFDALSIVEMVSIGRGTDRVKLSLILYTSFFKLLRFQSCPFGTKKKSTLENEVKKRSYTAFYSSIFIFVQHSHKGYSGFNALKPQHYASRFELQANSLVKLLNF